MSRGPGKVERAIIALFAANPDLAFVTEEIAEHVYPGIAIEHRHRVSALRAAHRVVANDPDWRASRVRRMARTWVFFNHASLQSYALSSVMDYVHYGAPSPHYGDATTGRAALFAALQRDHNRRAMQPGTGAWWRDVEIHRLRRAGREDEARAIEEQREREIAAILGPLRAAAPPKPAVSVARTNFPQACGNSTLRNIPRPEPGMTAGEHFERHKDELFAALERYRQARRASPADVAQPPAHADNATLPGGGASTVPRDDLHDAVRALLTRYSVHDIRAALEREAGDHDQ